MKAGAIALILLALAGAPPRDLERERALLVGVCLAAVEEVTRLTTLGVAILLPEAKRECHAAPGPTLYRLKGGRVFEWRPMPGQP